MTNLKAPEPGTLTRMVAEAMREYIAEHGCSCMALGDEKYMKGLAEAALAVAFNPNRGARVE